MVHLIVIFGKWVFEVTYEKMKFFVNFGKTKWNTVGVNGVASLVPILGKMPWMKWMIYI